MSRKEILPNLIFICLTLLPLLGLLIMNFQLTEANALSVPITSQAISNLEGDKRVTPFFAVVLFFLIIFAVIMTIAKQREAKKKSKRDIVDIDTQISSLNGDITSTNSKIK